MSESAVNGGSSTLAADIIAGATTITIQAGDTGKFPASGTYRIALADGTHVEICTVTGGQGTSSLTVTRATEAYAGVQTAFAFAAATPTNVTQVLTSQGLQNLVEPQIDIQAGTTSSPTTSSTTYVDLVNPSSTITTLAGSDLEASFSGSFQNDTGAQAVAVALALDGAAEVADRAVTFPNANSPMVVTCNYVFKNVSAGSHTIKVRWFVSGGIGTAGTTRRNLIVKEIRRT